MLFRQIIFDITKKMMKRETHLPRAIETVHEIRKITMIPLKKLDYDVTTENC